MGGVRAGSKVSTRVTSRELMRDEVQELLHETFNLLESVRRELSDESSRPLQRHEAEFLERINTLVGLLSQTHELLRARVLPIIG